MAAVMTMPIPYAAAIAEFWDLAAYRAARAREDSERRSLAGT